MQLTSPHPPLISVLHSLLVQKHAHSSRVCPLFLLSCFSHLRWIVPVLRALWSLDSFGSTWELIRLPQTCVSTPPPTVHGISFRPSCDSEGLIPEAPIFHESLLAFLSIYLLSNKSRNCGWGLWVCVCVCVCVCARVRAHVHIGVCMHILFLKTSLLQVILPTKKK